MRKSKIIMTEDAWRNEKASQPNGKLKRENKATESEKTEDGKNI